jgi:2-desacetyl-2-hydroxyethyl bacteriochlorophyllide A dehydrogenase
MSVGEAMPVPEEMSALRVHAFGELPRLDRVPVPEPGPEDVLVRIGAGVISHHDLTVAGGNFPLRPTLPYVPGLEGAGRIVRAGVGADPRTLAVGALVRVFAGGLGATRPGTWAEYVVAPARAVRGVPETLDVPLAAACGSVARAAWAAAIDLGALQPAERLGVTGATGAVGSLVAQLASRHGASGIVAWVRSPDRVHMLPGGVEIVYGDESVEPVEPVDLLVDTVGGPLLAERLRSVRPGGRLVLVGYTAGERICFSLPDIMAASVSLLPLNMMRQRVPAEVESRLVEDVAEGRLHVATEIVERHDVGQAIIRLRTGTVTGRLVLQW